MEYKLAKSLKDAGFPQIKNVGAKGEFLWGRRKEHQSYAPTLEELIEACGSSFYLLRRLNQGTRARIQWEAITEDYTQGEGETKKEAVARLWLALQK